jgi:ABC-type Fe3+-siderophore transport system permease subunit
VDDRPVVALDARGRRVRWNVARVALISALLSPVTGAGLLLAFAYIRGGTAVPQDVYTVYFRHLVVSFVFFGALPAGLLTGMGLSTLVRLRARRLSPRNVLLLGTALGAACGLLITCAILAGAWPPRLWALASALNGAMWGLLIACVARCRRVHQRHSEAS